MAEANRCPECGAELPSGFLAGICPKCLLAAGLESAADPHSSAKGGSDAPTTPVGAGFVPPAPEWLATHFPQLEILELLGSGGMGAVYKARQPRLDRLVALKIIRPESADAPAFAERFNREARLLARLSHPQIVAVYDFGSVEISLREMNAQAEREGHTELYYFLMEYVDGANLRDLMRSGELMPKQALAIVPQICEALQFAHDEGVVHRDIKPENILLDKKGRVKIADFGLAKLAAGLAADYTLTATHQVMGTPRYMAPEQMEGSHAVDHRADIYSLGVVFYEMLTGEVPAGHFEPPSKKVEIDVRLDEVVLRSLAREPERRYQHASDVKSDVESISSQLRPSSVSAATPVAVAQDADGSFLGFLGSAIHVFLVVVLILFGLGIVLGGQDALRPLGIPATGIWERLAQLAALSLIIAALVSLGYEWKWPRGSKRASNVATDGQSLKHTRNSERGGTSPAMPQRGGRDWVTLTREQIENDRLPDCCIVCGRHTIERVNKNFDYQSDLAGFLCFIGFWFFILPGLIIWSLTYKTIRVACPICPTHREAWRRFVWIASTGWLAVPVAAMIGLGVAYPWAGLDSPAVWVGPVLGAVIGLIAYVVLLTPLWRQRVSVEWMTSAHVRLRRVSMVFARGAEELAGAAQRESGMTDQSRHSGTVRTAWDAWWAERDRWVATSAQVVLGLLLFLWVFMYSGGHGSSRLISPGDGEQRRHTIVEIGQPVVWFRCESWPDDKTSFRWEFRWYWALAYWAVGYLLSTGYWQIEKAKANVTSKKFAWLDSPASFTLLWVVVTLIAVAWGIHPMYLS